MRLLTFIVARWWLITASVEGFFHFGDRWRHYRVGAMLKRGLAVPHRVGQLSQAR
jgi:hypothetical protein